MPEIVMQIGEYVLMAVAVASIIAKALQKVVEVTPVKPEQVYLSKVMGAVDKVESVVRKFGFHPPKWEEGKKK